MTIHGQVHNGVVVLEGGHVLPEGMNVTVSCDFARDSGPPRQQKPVEFPLVHSKHPGDLHLTAARVAELLEEEDVSP